MNFTAYRQHWKPRSVYLAECSTLNTVEPGCIEFEVDCKIPWYILNSIYKIWQQISIYTVQPRSLNAMHPHWRCASCSNLLPIRILTLWCLLRVTGHYLLHVKITADSALEPATTNYDWWWLVTVTGALYFNSHWGTLHFHIAIRSKEAARTFGQLGWLHQCFKYI